jgi:hypothetical protein
VNFTIYWSFYFAICYIDHFIANIVLLLILFLPFVVYIFVCLFFFFVLKPNWN